MNQANKARRGSDTESLNGAFIDIALGSDFDGLTDHESNRGGSVDLSEEEDGVNVTIREIIKPKLDNASTPKIASVVVVPKSTMNAQMSSNMDISCEKERNKYDKPLKKANRSGYEKRNAKLAKSGLNNSTIASMFANSGKNNNDKQQNIAPSALKRNRGPRSPDSSYENSRPYKRPNVPSPRTNVNEGNVNDVEMPQPSNLSYRDVTLLSLQFIVCLMGRPQGTIAEARKIKKVLFQKIEDAIVNRTASPIFRYHVPKDDGLYVGCADSTCADWLRENMVGIVPWEGCESKITVISQSEPPKLVRTVVCVPTRNNNNYILDIFTQLNRNLNVDKWIIRARRPVGAYKTSLFIRMDEESIDRLKTQNYKAYWILGTVQVNLEKQKDSQTTAANQTSVENEAPGDNRVESSSFATSQSTGSKVQPSQQRLTHKGGPASKGKAKSKPAK